MARNAFLRNGRRWAALVLTVSISLTSLGACGKNEKPHFVMRTYSTLGESADRAVYSDILSQYTKTHKNVVINDTTTTPAAGYKMALSIASTYRGANVPDVIYYSSIKDMSQLSDFFMTKSAPIIPNLPLRSRKPPLTAPRRMTEIATVFLYGGIGAA